MILLQCMTLWPLPVSIWGMAIQVSFFAGSISQSGLTCHLGNGEYSDIVGSLRHNSSETSLSCMEDDATMDLPDTSSPADIGTPHRDHTQQDGPLYIEHVPSEHLLFVAWLFMLHFSHWCLCLYQAHTQYSHMHLAYGSCAAMSALAWNTLGIVTCSPPMVVVLK